MNFFKNLFFRKKQRHSVSSENTAEIQTPVETKPASSPNAASDSENGPATTASAPATSAPAARIHPVAWQIADCIESEFSSPELSVHGFAQALGMNPTYISRIFRSSYHMSVKDYINRARIHHSLEYLKETDMPIEEVARAVGFENTKYFFVLFKNIMGTTPRRYRMATRASGPWEAGR